MEDTKEAKEDYTNEEYRCELPNYSELIIEMIHNTSDIWILEQIYRYTKNMTKED